MTTLRYFGWSALSIETADGALFFDPFFRSYCGAQWFGLDDFRRARYICVTHGHEEHFLDVPVIAKATDAVIVGSPSVCTFLKWRRGIPAERLRVIDPKSFGQLSLPGFKLTAFLWKHRDINLPRALSRALFHGNATQLSWALHSATQAPFYSPYTGYHVELPDGLTVLNYNEGFNTKMTDAEIEDLGRRLKTDVLLAGMQLNFVADVVRGVAALKPRLVVLYPPHEHFHAMMGVVSEPWPSFAAAVRERFPEIEVRIAEPGFALDLKSHSVDANVPWRRASEEKAEYTPR
ncbi:MAG: MBL fold metallo-hydrolase [Alphaproteobacteria bacterium]|nr:MBL fold metallo-hydrolase [Alphaproteobacteria bacterium]